MVWRSVRAADRRGGFERLAPSLLPKSSQQGRYALCRDVTDWTWRSSIPVPAASRSACRFLDAVPLFCAFQATGTYRLGHVARLMTIYHCPLPVLLSRLLREDVEERAYGNWLGSPLFLAKQPQIPTICVSYSLTSIRGRPRCLDTP